MIWKRRKVSNHENEKAWVMHPYFIRYFKGFMYLSFLLCFIYEMWRDTTWCPSAWLANNSDKLRYTQDAVKSCVCCCYSFSSGLVRCSGLAGAGRLSRSLVSRFRPTSPLVSLKLPSWFSFLSELWLTVRIAIAVGVCVISVHLSNK